MRRAFEPGEQPERLREKVIGLGDHSSRKSYYPLLRARLADLERFRALLDESSDAVMMAELPSLRINDVNAAACRMLGLGRQALLDGDLARLAPAVAALARGNTTDGTRHTVQTTVYRANGEPVAVEMTLSFAQFGPTQYAVATSRDITQRLEAERALRASENLARAVFEGASIGLVVLDASGKVHDANAVYSAMSGYSVEALRNMPFEQLVPAEDVERLRAQFSRLMSGQEDRQAYEARCVRSDGRVLPVAITTSRLSSSSKDRSSDGGDTSPALVVVSVEDITERKRSEEDRERLCGELRTANRLKDEFLTTVSHVLRTPLTCVLAWAQLLKSGRTHPDTILRGLAALERNAAELAQLIDDLLDVSALSAGNLNIASGSVHLATIIDDVLAHNREKAEAKGVTLDVTLDRSADALQGDASRLKQMVWNLVDNAIKFTPRSGRIEVRLSRRGDTLELVVSDTGQGIASELLPHVFERFRPPRAMRATSSRAGLGLGLAIVRGLASLHHGTVRAESEGAGKGARFTLTLPVANTGGDVARIPDQRPCSTAAGVAAQESRPAAIPALASALQRR